MHQNNLEGPNPESICDNKITVVSDIICSCCTVPSVVDDCNNCELECADVDLVFDVQYNPYVTSIYLHNTETNATVWNTIDVVVHHLPINMTSKVCPTKCYYFNIDFVYGYGDFTLDFQESRFLSLEGDLGNCE